MGKQRNGKPPVETSGEAELQNKINETAEAINEGEAETLPTGTEIEEQIQSEDNPPEPPLESSQPDEPPANHIPGKRGPKKGSKYRIRDRSHRNHKAEYERRKQRESQRGASESHSQPGPPPVPENRIDVIAIMLNASVIPGAAYKLKKNYKECLITDDQQKELLKLQPPGAFTEPSWVTYTVLAISMVVINFMQASEVERKKEATETPGYFEVVSRKNSPEQNGAITTAEAAGATAQ